MKKIVNLFCFIITLVIISPVAAQINVGFQGGITLPNISWTNEDITLDGNFKINPGMNAGILCEYAFSPELAFLSGLFYEQAGTRYKEEISEEDWHTSEEVKARANYFVIPVLVKYKYEVKEKMNIFGIGGPYYGYLLSGKAKGDITGDYNADIDVDIKDNAKSSDFGLVIGAGVEKQLKKYNIFVDFRYKIGLSNGAESGGYFEEVDLTAKNKGFSINIGILGLLSL